MKPYRLKHVPTGLYYQPHRSGGSHLSKKGKIYQTSIHGLSSAFRYKEKYPDRDKFLVVYAEENSQVYKQTWRILQWTSCRWRQNQIQAPTLLSDWVIEEL